MLTLSLSLPTPKYRTIFPKRKNFMTSLITLGFYFPLHFLLFFLLSALGIKPRKDLTQTEQVLDHIESCNSASVQGNSTIQTFNVCYLTENHCKINSKMSTDPSTISKKLFILHSLTFFLFLRVISSPSLKSVLAVLSKVSK